MPRQVNQARLRPIRTHRRPRSLQWSLRAISSSGWVTSMSRIGRAPIRPQTHLRVEFCRHLSTSPLSQAPIGGYGGSTLLGTPDANVYPLMTALKLQNSRTKFYGWVAPSVNYSTSSKNSFPLSYDVTPNRLELNQAVVYIERLPDTVKNNTLTSDTTSPAFWYGLPLHNGKGLPQPAIALGAC